MDSVQLSFTDETPSNEVTEETPTNKGIKNIIKYIEWKSLIIEKD